MTEDIEPEVLKRTQDTLGKFIKKPVLTEKLLRKPPFRFLHDICTAAMKETGFFEGILLGNDVKADSIKDKDGKIAFLQKVIAAVESANNVKLSIKPNKVVAGHEPVKTNEFLQALASALEKQAEVNNSKKPLRKTRPPDASKKSDDALRKKNAANKTQKPRDPSTEVPSKEIKKSKKTSEKQQESGSAVSKKREKEIGEKSSRRRGSVLIENEATANGETGGEKKGVPILMNGDTHHEDGAEEKEQKLNSAVENMAEDEQPIEKQETKVIARPQSAKIKRTPSARPVFSAVEETKPPADSLPNRIESDPSAEVFGNIVSDSRLVKESPSAAPPDKPQKPTSPEKVSPAVEPVPATPSPPQRPPTASGKKDNDSGIVTRPRTAIRPTTARPASARPAAPRVRDRGQIQLQEEVIKPAVGKVNLIVEQEAALVDDEELVAVQTTQDPQDILDSDVPIVSASDETIEGEHGHLVSQILEAQKELEEDAFANKKGSTVSTEIEWAVSRGAEASNKEVERLRAAIQTLTRSANPLGKLLEFLQEDVDTMHLELETWREKNSNLSLKLEQERSLTDQSIEPLKSHLEELQSRIDQQVEQIAALKATVLRNEERMVRILTGL